MQSVSYVVDLTTQATDDLQRIFDFTLERELSREGGDLDLADQAIGVIFREMKRLEWSPLAYRRAGECSSARELVIPFGGSGFVVLFEILDDAVAKIVAIRNQREDGDAD